MGADCCAERERSIYVDGSARVKPQAKRVKAGAIEFQEKHCLDCTSKLSYNKEAVGSVCDSCQTDIGRAEAYKCSGSCEFAICKNCTECLNRHVLSFGSGKPTQYTSEHSVTCNRCNAPNLERQEAFSYCEPCDYAVCLKCIPQN